MRAPSVINVTYGHRRGIEKGARHIAANTRAMVMSRAVRKKLTAVRHWCEQHVLSNMHAKGQRGRRSPRAASSATRRFRLDSIRQRCPPDSNRSRTVSDIPCTTTERPPLAWFPADASAGLRQRTSCSCTTGCYAAAVRCKPERLRQAFNRNLPRGDLQGQSIRAPGRRLREDAKWIARASAIVPSDNSRWVDG